MIGPTSEMNIHYQNNDISRLYKDDKIETYLLGEEITPLMTNLSSEEASKLIQVIIEVSGPYQSSKIFEKFKDVK